MCLTNIESIINILHMQNTDSNYFLCELQLVFLRREHFALLCPWTRSLEIEECNYIYQYLRLENNSK